MEKIPWRRKLQPAPILLPEKFHEQRSPAGYSPWYSKMLDTTKWLSMPLKLQLKYFGHLMWRTDSGKRPWCWERLKAEEGDDRGWDGWMASPPRWTWVWLNSGSQWWTGRPGMLQSMGSQRVRHNWATELNSGISAFSTTLPYLLQKTKQICPPLNIPKPSVSQ